MYRFARFDEPLLNKLPQKKLDVDVSHPFIPERLRRREPPNIPNLEEQQVVRHFFRLSQMNYGIESGMYPLGSCTMKYNPKICEDIASWREFTDIHPYQDESTIQGTLEILYELEEMLKEITGMHAFSFQPAAGAHGEFLGMLIVRAYHEFNEDKKRREVIIPDTAHGTNPASAKMAGFDVIEIPSNSEGTVDLDALEKTLSDKTAALMLTNPNTLGIFESDILEIGKMVHDAGALLYYDGANLNAILGKARPGDMGFDIVHLNLHKTFATPHGGGGPGAGPVGVKEHLEKFLPVPRIKKDGKRYVLDYDKPHSVGKIRDFYGNIEVCIKAYVYLLLMGKNLKEVAEVSVLNANYMKEKLKRSGLYELPYKDLRKHEFVLSCEKLLKEKGIRALDVAKRLLDHGMHPPTIYFPLIVKEALMIEPTETETKEEIDAYIEALVSIAKEDPEIVKASPTKTPVKRIDEASAVRNPVLTWKEM